MIRPWIIILVCLLCVFGAVSAFQYGGRRVAPPERPQPHGLPRGATHDPIQQRPLSSFDFVTHREPYARVESHPRPSSPECRRPSQPAAAPALDSAEFARDAPREDTRSPSPLRELPADLSEAMARRPSNPDPEPTNVDAVVSSSSRSFPALARKTRAPQSSISSQYLSSFHVGIPPLERVGYVTERFTRHDDADEDPPPFDRASSPAVRATSVDALGDARAEPTSGYNTARELETDMETDMETGDDSIGSDVAQFEVDGRNTVVATMDGTSDVEPETRALDDSVGDRRVYEADRSARFQAAPVPAPAVDSPILFMRTELTDRVLRVFSPHTFDVVEIVHQTDDDFTHVAMAHDQRPLRFNGVLFQWIPSECKQNQPIFFLSGGIHVTHVGSTITLKLSDEMHEIAIDRAYGAYLVCIWSYDDQYHMSVLGKHRTAGWDSSWYGITIRRQPLWMPLVKPTLHVHRSIHDLVWYQSNAGETAIPDEGYLQSIAAKRFQ